MRRTVGYRSLVEVYELRRVSTFFFLLLVVFRLSYSSGLSRLLVPKSISRASPSSTLRTSSAYYTTTSMTRTTTLHAFPGLECMSDLHYNFAEVAFSGAMAGGCRAFSRALTYPLDTLKTRQQVSPEKTEVFSFTASDFSRMFNKDYFKGVLPAVLSAFPANSVFFSVYYFLLALAATSCFHATGSDISSDTAPQAASDALLFFERLVFSCIATVPQNAIKVPAELIKQRAQVEPNLSLFDLFLDAMSDPKIGFRGLFVGSNAQLLREVPFNAIQMSTFQYFKDNFLVSGADASHVALFGLLSAAFAALLTQPADVVKSRMMVRHPLKPAAVAAAGAVASLQPAATTSTAVGTTDSSTSGSGISSVIVGTVSAVTEAVEATTTTTTATSTTATVAAAYVESLTALYAEQQSSLSSTVVERRPSPAVVTTAVATVTAATTTATTQHDDDQSAAAVAAAYLEQSPAHPVAYLERPTTIIECFKSIVSERGIAGLYVGLIPRLLLVSFGGMIYFASAEYAQTIFEISFSSGGHK